MNLRTVLIVDDEPGQRKLMREILSGEGYGVLEASGYREAVEAQEKHLGEIDLLVIDLVLPGGNGYELFKALREREPRLKVLFVCGRTGSEVRRFLDAPLPDVYFLQKPLHAEELLERLKTVLDSAGPLADAAAC